MQLTCDTKKLSQALQSAIRIIKKENYLRLEAKNNKLKFETAEAPEFASATISADIKEEGECIVNAQLMANLISKIQDEAIIINTAKDKDGNNKLLQVIYKLEKSKPAKADLPIILDANMLKTPLLVPEKELEFNKQDFDTIIRKVIFASAKETDTNSKLCCVQFNFLNKYLCANATDTHIIAQKIIKCDNADAFDVVIPVSTLNHVLSIKSEKDTKVKIAIQNNIIQFTVDNISVINQVMNTKYPPVNKVIPKQGELDIDITLNREETISTIQRLSLFNSKSDPLIIQIENGQITMQTKTANGEIKETIDSKNNSNTESNRLGLNTNYLLNILNSIESEEVDVSWKNGQTRLVLFKDKKDVNVRYVLSPVRIAAA